MAIAAKLQENNHLLPERPAQFELLVHSCKGYHKSLQFSLWNISINCFQMLWTCMAYVTGVARHKSSFLRGRKINRSKILHVHSSSGKKKKKKKSGRSMCVCVGRRWVSPRWVSPKTFYFMSGWLREHLALRDTGKL